VLWPIFGHHVPSALHSREGHSVVPHEITSDLQVTADPFAPRLQLLQFHGPEPVLRANKIHYEVRVPVVDQDLNFLIASPVLIQRHDRVVIEVIQTGQTAHGPLSAHLCMDGCLHTGSVQVRCHIVIGARGEDGGNRGHPKAAGRFMVAAKLLTSLLFEYKGLANLSRLALFAHVDINIINIDGAIQCILGGVGHCVVAIIRTRVARPRPEARRVVAFANVLCKLIGLGGSQAMVAAIWYVRVEVLLTVCVCNTSCESIQVHECLALESEQRVL